MSSCIAIVVAAGRGVRFGGIQPKQYAALGNRPVIRIAIERLLAHPRIAAVQPVIHPDDQAAFAEATAGLGVMLPVVGGATRQASARNGLEALALSHPDVVLIHDAARPLVPPQLVDRILDGIRPGLGVVPALAVADTLKQIDAAGRVISTVPREGLVRVQTPQGFRYEEILSAHLQAAHLSLTDDAAVFEHAGHGVATVIGAVETEKVTTTDDLARLSSGMFETRIGQGFDAHRLIPGPGVTLCGVVIPHSHKLLGHSDADAAWHAATDAILGAIGAGDIGAHFPPSNPAFKDAPSEIFLRHAIDMMRARGGALVNMDITIICERPKVAPHRAAMIERTASVCGVAPGRVSIKATTTEAMGFTGRGEGIAAQAIVSVTLPRVV